MYNLQEERNDLIEWNFNELKQMINKSIEDRFFNLNINIGQMEEKIKQIKQIYEVKK